MKTPEINKKEIDEDEKEKSLIITSTPEFSVPKDLIDDLKKDKIDPLTEGKTNLGYEERAPRKKELEDKDHKDREDI